MRQIILSFVAVLIITCTSVNDDLKEEKRVTKSPVSHQEMIEKTKKILTDSTELSNEEKGKFLKLHENVIQDTAHIDRDIYKLKIILYKSISSQDYNEAKVKILLYQLKRLNNKKFDIMSKALITSRDILGVSPDGLYHEEGHYGRNFDL